MGFHDVTFPVALSLGSTSGLERRTEIVTLASGHEERNTPWAEARRRYDAGVGVRALGDLEAVMAFFEARRGRLFAFRWRDAMDHASAPLGQPIGPIDQRIGTGDGATTEFQLSKTYGEAPTGAVRRIKRPVPGSVRVAVGGAETGAFAVDPATGVLTFDAAPAAGAVVTAGFRFDVPVRFDTDRIDVSLTAFEAGEIPSIPVIEVRA